MWLLYTCVHLIGLLEYDRSGEEAQTMNLYFCSFLEGGGFGRESFVIGVWGCIVCIPVSMAFASNCFSFDLVTMIESGGYFLFDKLHLFWDLLPGSLQLFSTSLFTSKCLMHAVTVQYIHTY